MEECSYIKVDGTVASDAMKKLDELWRNIDPVRYSADVSFLKDNPHSFFYTGAYYGAKMMAKLLFGQDFEIAYVPTTRGRCEHRLEVVDETDVR